MKKLQRRIFEILESGERGDLLSQLFASFILTLISLNLVIFTLETVESYWHSYRVFFVLFDTFSVVVFSLEYGLRVWSCTADETFKHPLWGRLRFICTPLLIIDFLSILPFYLPIFFPDLIFLRTMRLLRLCRLLKLGRYSDSLKILWRVLVSQKEELIVTFSVLFILAFFASSLVYLAEHEAQSEAFPNIPTSMWWVVITLTTVGYGDVYPVTPLGKFIGAILAILGIGIFALPAGILASGFSEELRCQRIQKQTGLTKVCPHCGEVIEESSNPIRPRSSLLK